MATAPVIAALERARDAWAKTQDQLDIFSVLNAAPDPPLTLAGRSVEGGRTERQGRDGRGSESARAWLTAAAASHAHGGCAPPPSTETKQGEEHERDAVLD